MSDFDPTPPRRARTGPIGPGGAPEPPRSSFAEPAGPGGAEPPRPSFADIAGERLAPPMPPPLTDEQAEDVSFDPALVSFDDLFDPEAPEPTAGANSWLSRKDASSGDEARAVDVELNADEEYSEESLTTIRLIDQGLAHPQCSEIHANGPDKIFLKFRGSHKRLKVGFSNEGQFNRWLKSWVDAAESVITWEDLKERRHATLQMSDGSSLTIVLPPMVASAHLTVRKHNLATFRAADLVANGTMTRDMMQFLQTCVAARANMLIVGPMGSGKSQPLDALVLTPNGYVTMGALSVGDAIVGGSSRSPQCVTAIHPQGTLPVWNVVVEGARTRCCPEHLWSVSVDTSAAEQEIVSTTHLADLVRAGVSCWLPSHDADQGLVPVLAVEPTDEIVEQQCIEVDDPKSLYVTNGGIVTHNTSALSLLTQGFADSERVAIVEEVPEIWINKPQVAQFTYMPSEEGLGLSDLLETLLYMRIDRVVVGEAHFEITKMLEIMLTGADGSMCTYHARSISQAVERMKVGLQFEHPNLNDRTAVDMIRSALEVVVVLGIRDGKHRCLEIGEIDWRSSDKANKLGVNILFEYDAERGGHRVKNRLNSDDRIAEKCRQYNVPINWDAFRDDEMFGR